ncbi:hypothetical protein CAUPRSCDRAFT_10488 [Caulochytrium protostelioides]|uniref:Uncharacterized protein n=1 Tax=Caulochytrium protostelioides TaxID=1555241 RepID=A0A4P9WWQ9_9FUNG|nr:hypothetical protein CAUPRSCDRAFT_10488 [Caulochytrium protostelioides]
MDKVLHAGEGLARVVRGDGDGRHGHGERLRHDKHMSRVGGVGRRDGRMELGEPCDGRADGCEGFVKRAEPGRRLRVMHRVHGEAAADGPGSTLGAHAIVRPDGRGRSLYEAPFSKADAVEAPSCRSCATWCTSWETPPRSWSTVAGAVACVASCRAVAPSTAACDWAWFSSAPAQPHVEDPAALVGGAATAAASGGAARAAGGAVVAAAAAGRVRTGRAGAAPSREAGGDA